MVDAGGLAGFYFNILWIWMYDNGLQSIILHDGAVHWIFIDVCCSWFCLCWTNGMEELWMASTVCSTTCGMADGTEVSSIGETESLGRMVDPQEGDSVFA